MFEVFWGVYWAFYLIGVWIAFGILAVEVTKYRHGPAWLLLALLSWLLIGVALSLDRVTDEKSWFE